MTRIQSIARTAHRLLRVYQWPKNLLVLMPLVFALEMSRPGQVLRACAALAAFCLASSGTYIFNDIRDIEQDRGHPTKCRRPLAAGEISVALAAVLALFLIVAAVGVGWWVRPKFLVPLCGYLVLTASYTLLLKHVFLVDVISVALGFVIRAMAGAVAINVIFSNWLMVCTLFLALLLSLGKRRTEIALLDEQAAAHRAVLDRYDTAFIDQLLLLVAGGALITYTIYTCSPEVVARVHTDKLYMTLPFVLYGLARYLWLIRETHHGGDPSALLIRDWPTLVAVGLWMAACVGLLYWT
jgi:4-hydroxybenzoate polyprenyltransferase